MSDELALLVDFGSTYTKLRAVDLGAARLLATAQGPSTVASDVTLGLDAALDRLHAALGRRPRWRLRLGASSAAGGLRMVTVGLVRELTAEAARQAALGAGAKLVGHFCGRLTQGDLRAIAALAPDVLLLCGGTDGGNRDVILHNAAQLARTAQPTAPIVVAGNREAADEIAALLPAAVIAGNVMPELNRLDTDPARAAIREVFMRRIVQAKGIDRARASLDDEPLPTPAAVLEGAMLLARGPGGSDGLGPLVVVDPGGATTDVHSIGDGEPALPGTVRVGLPPPWAQRSVEGDLGMRHNAASIVEAVGEAAFAAAAGLALPRVRALLDAIAADVERLPASAEERAFDRALGRSAIALAVRRHAGRRETVYTAHGPVPVQRGKDLSTFRTLIGTGGVLAAAPDAGALLAAACADGASAAGDALLPAAPRCLVDRDYLLFAAGLLAAAEPRAAFELARSSLRPVDAAVPAGVAHA